MMLLKHCAQYVIKFGKFSSGHRTGKGQFSFQSQRMAMPKNFQTTVQLCSFNARKVMVKILHTRLHQYTNQHVLQHAQTGLKKAEEPEIKLLTSVDHRERKNSRKISTSASLSMLKPLTVWITTNCGKFSKRWEYQITLPIS